MSTVYAAPRRHTGALVVVGEVVVGEPVVVTGCAGPRHSMRSASTSTLSGSCSERTCTLLGWPASSENWPSSAPSVPGSSCWLTSTRDVPAACTTSCGAAGDRALLAWYTTLRRYRPLGRPLRSNWASRPLLDSDE